MNCFLNINRRPMTHMQKFGLTLILLFSLFAYGCGYHIGGGPTAIPGQVKSVSVPVFDNLTREPELGSALAEAMRREILRRKAVTLLPTNQAEAVIRGVAEDAGTDPLSFDRNGLTTAYRVWLKVSVRLERRGEILWRVEHIVKDEQIIVDDQPLDNAVRREYALNKIAQDMMRQVHTMMLEGF